MSLTFLGVGFCAFAAILAARRLASAAVRPWAELATLPLVALAGFSLLRSPETLGPSDWLQSPFWRGIVLFHCMIAGMVGRSLSHAIEDRRDRVVKWHLAGSPGQPPRIEFDRWEFAYPLLFSAITFGTLLGQLKTQEITMESVLLSFQTGFFWQTLLAARGAAPAAEPARQAARTR